MHYYKRNLGDYAKKAGRLSMLQHGSYTLLIDACYDREQFPTRDEAIDWTWASSTAEVEAVDFVLSKFFTLEDGRYVQKRIQEEIAEYHGKAENNARIAREREAKRKAEAEERARIEHESCTTGAQVVDEAPPNHKPLTTNHKPSSVPIGTGAADATPTARDLVFANGVPLLTVAGVAEKNARSMLAGLCKRSGDEAVASAIAECAKARPVEPVSWLQAVLAGKAPANKQQAIEDRNRAVADAWIPPELRGAQPQEAH